MNSEIPYRLGAAPLDGHDGLLLPVHAPSHVTAHEHAQVRPDRYGAARLTPPRTFCVPIMPPATQSHLPEKGRQAGSACAPLPRQRAAAAESYAPRSRSHGVSSGPLRAQYPGGARNLSCDWVDGAKATESHCWSGPFANNEFLIQQCGEKFSSSSRNGKEIGRQLQVLPSIGRQPTNTMTSRNTEIRRSEVRHLLYSASGNGRRGRKHGTADAECLSRKMSSPPISMEIVAVPIGLDHEVDKSRRRRRLFPRLFGELGLKRWL